MAWLTLSAPAADANNALEQSSSLGGITSTVSAVGTVVNSAAGGASAALVPDSAAPQPERVPSPLAFTDATGPVASVPADAGLISLEPVAAPDTAAPGAAEAPVVTAGPVDTVLGEEPSLDGVPAGTVTAVTDPVVALADTAAGELTETATNPVADALPVDLPSEPISDLLTGTPPPIDSVVTPITDVLDVVNDLAEVADRTRVLPALGHAQLVRAGGAVAAPPYSTGASDLPRAGASVAPLRAGSSGSGESPGSSPAVPAGGGSPAGGGTPAPEALLPTSPAGLGSSAQSSGGAAPAAAWLSGAFEYLPLTGLVPMSGPLQHIPSPVAIDPGSSPD